jgi:hypothetical protein
MYMDSESMAHIQAASKEMVLWKLVLNSKISKLNYVGLQLYNGKKIRLNNINNVVYLSVRFINSSWSLSHYCWPKSLLLD